jgi:hypothetical protein
VDHGNALMTPGNVFSNGAFSFTSPPNRVLLSDTTNQISPFNCRYTILKFNSANKNGNNSNKSQKANSSNGSKNNFAFQKTKNLMDLKVDDQILGKGIFSTPA